MTSRSPGPRDELITHRLRRMLGDLAPDEFVEQGLGSNEAPAKLSRLVAEALKGAIGGRDLSAEEAAGIANLLLLQLPEFAPEDSLELPPSKLTGIRRRNPIGEFEQLPAAPSIPFGQSDLLVNAAGQPRIGSELKTELASAKDVDLICAFVIWSGVRHLLDELEGVIERGGRVRVITTTYMGVTEQRAVDELVKIGAQVHVAMDGQTTKLHAKAWLLGREGGLTTAFVGSSNLSHTALFDGLEWNVRLSEVDTAHLIDRIQMMFESHWASEHFAPYDPQTNGEQFAEALTGNKRRAKGEVIPISFANIEVRPRDFQERFLEDLMIERERHDRHRNLVVAATGTGKTVVAAFDYQRLCRRSGEDLSLLFVAHREQILEQSLATFRAVLRDQNFGEIHGGGKRASGRHVFAMIGSLGAKQLAEIDSREFDVVIIDEFHHAKAPTYARLLDHVEPKELLGLTATPERLDGQDVTEWFGNHISVELRLWEAIDEGLLVPFQYFGVADGTDLSAVQWSRGSYAVSELTSLYTADDQRVRILLRAIERIVLRPDRMRALGFCVSVEHAEFMARKFNDSGLASAALSGTTPQKERSRVLGELRAGRIRCVFSVDVLGEGVDVPDVDTLLLLRPTASATVFTQQLGRGLRTAKDKSHLTVIDMVGQHRKEFRFEDRMRAIVDTRNGPIKEQVEAGFPYLPSGCTIDLDRKSADSILANIKQAAARTRWKQLIDEVKRDPEQPLAEFLRRQGIAPEHLYRGGHSWSGLRRAAGVAPAPRDSGITERFDKGAGRLLHIDDAERLARYSDWLACEEPPDIAKLDERARRLFTMLAWDLGAGEGDFADLNAFASRFWHERELRDELVELFGVLDARSTTLTRPSGLDPQVPLALHGRYTRNEIVAALGHGRGVNIPSTREGILWVEPAGCDAFFVDLHKHERDYSPTTLYRDYAISRTLFHWESQSRQRPGTPTVERYINHERMGTKVLLFVREKKHNEFRTLPFTFLGAVDYVDHKGEKPVRFTWRLPVAMPEDVFEVARSVAVA